MHEFGIAESILEAVRSEAKKAGGVRPLEVGLRIGAVSGVECEALRFAFEALARDTDLHGLVLEIETVPHTRRCPGCEESFEAPDWGGPCPQCGGLKTEFVGGDEMIIAYVEAEESCHA